MLDKVSSKWSSTLRGLFSFSSALILFWDNVHGVGKEEIGFSSHQFVTF